MSKEKSMMETLMDKLHEDNIRQRKDREAQTIKGLNFVRESLPSAHLREPGSSYGTAPASRSTPSFKLGDVAGFPYPTDRLPDIPGLGNLSPAANREFMDQMKSAAVANKAGDLSSRDASTGKAANAVSQDYVKQHGHNHEPSMRQQVLHEVRAQVTFATAEIGQKLGLGPIESKALGYSLERALEKEGFRTLVNHGIDKALHVKDLAVDKVSDMFKPSSASVASATGARHNNETNLSKAMNWLGQHGVSREGMKILANHPGKLHAAMELAQNPAVFSRAAVIIANSDKIGTAVTTLANDKEFRQATGNLMIGAGETVGMANKGLASAAIVAGSMVRGDSSEATGRRIFEAAMAIAGGAAGGIAGGAVSGGALAIAGGVAGSAAGSALATKILEVYDKHIGHAPVQEGKLTNATELKQSLSVLEQRGVAGIKSKVHEAGGSALENLKSSHELGKASDSGKVSGVEAAKDKVAALGREYSMGNSR